MRRPPLLALALLCLLAILAGCGPLPAPATPGEPPIAITGVTVIPLDRERVLSDHTVVVQAGRITAVGPTADIPLPPHARIIDGRGKYLLPGLADMHVHIEREIDLLLYLARGVTTARVMWGAPVHVEWRDQIAKGERIGPRLYVAGPIVDGEDPPHDGSLILTRPEDAAAAVALHKAARYDFIKVYNKIPEPAYRSLLAAAKAASLPVAGHVPYAVGLDEAIDSGQASLEHLTGFLDELQQEGSPVRRKFDRASRQQKIDHVDPARLPALAARVAASHAWICPTLDVLEDLPAAEHRARLASPEMKYVPPLLLAVWQPRDDPPPEVMARRRRDHDMNLRIVRALRDAGARFLVGTDTGNPLVVPGFATHDELRRLVEAGLSPYQALRAATADTARFLGSSQETGTIESGKVADLLLVDDNPLSDITATGRIAGVMARGRWHGPEDLAALLHRVETAARGGDALAGAPPLEREGKSLFSATYEVIWKGARFGGERVSIEALDGERTRIRAQTYDAKTGQRGVLRLDMNAGGEAAQIHLTSDGASGRGEASVTLAGARGSLQGTLLSGMRFAGREVPLGAEDLVLAEGFLADKVLLGKRLAGLPVGERREIAVHPLALGSTVEMPAVRWTITRTPDAPLVSAWTTVMARRYEISPSSGPRAVLWLDEQGYPLGFEIQAFGDRVVFRRVA